MYFSIHKATNGQYYFLINSDNHEVVATSETYYYKESAERTIIQLSVVLIPIQWLLMLQSINNTFDSIC